MRIVRKIALLNLLICLVTSFQAYSQRKLFEYKPTYDSKDQIEYDKLLISTLTARRKEIEEENKRITVAKLKQTKSIYSSIENFPTIIKDGWHNVVATDNSDFCDNRKVYVVNNRINRYIVDDWSERNVSISDQISKGKSLIKLKYPDGTEGNYLNIYFIDYCINPNSITTPPIKPGKVNFWTNWKRATTITLYFEEEEIGNFTSYFDNSPNCEQSGTLTVTYKPGTYNYRAVGTTSMGGEVTWKGSVSISEGGCINHCLVKK